MEKVMRLVNLAPLFINISLFHKYPAEALYIFIMEKKKEGGYNTTCLFSKN